MSIESNKILVRRMFEEDLNTDNRAIASEFFDPNFHDHTNPPGMQHGIEGHIALETLLRAAFPDAHWTIEDLFAEDDRVCMRVTMTGTHLGDFFGTPPTGRAVTQAGIHILRVANDKIVEHWGINDDLALVRQLEPASETT
ncbi:MAG: ester cyclase [Anaerolineae bacterium]